jgi:hypothetical protein
MDKKVPRLRMFDVEMKTDQVPLWFKTSLLDKLNRSAE